MEEEAEEDFDYVVERKPPAAICFGSKIVRNTSPIGKGLSPFQKKSAPEIFPTGPGQYAIEKYNTALARIFEKIDSTKGVGPLASNDERFKEKILMKNPSPTRYNIDYKQTIHKKDNVPFGSKSCRLTTRENNFPGPGTYGTHVKKCQRTRFMYNFGHPTMLPTIEMDCVNRPTDTCVKCAQLCTGDYWHQNGTVYLCHLCWEEEKRGGELYKAEQLKNFCKIRNCSFVHRHEGTTAAIRLLPAKKIKKKIRKQSINPIPF